MRFVPISVFLCWLLAGLYLGIGGLTRAKLDDTVQEIDKEKGTLIKDSINITYNGLTFENKYELKYFLEVQSIEKVFPWAVKVSSFVALVITSFSFGLIGALIGLVKSIVFDDKRIDQTKYLSVPLLGLLTGFVIMGLSYLLPTVLTKNGGEIRPVTLMFLCLFGGLYSKQFYEKMTVYFNKLFL